jgi:hypothetical protein
MAVWMICPSARPANECIPVFDKWRERGYKIAIWRDAGDQANLAADFLVRAEYPGYAKACNFLIRCVLNMDQQCDWVVVGSDDTLPDQRNPEEIAKECSEHFFELQAHNPVMHLKYADEYSTFGCVQPTGDRFAGGHIDRICGSPWIGREFAKRMYGGNGPYWPGYHHIYADEEIQNVAEKYGVLWQRPDLIHLHNHWTRSSLDVNAVADYRRPRPKFLDEAYSARNWAEVDTLFKDRRRQGFPGHEPLAAAVAV